MSQVQPLSILAPEYSNQLRSTQQMQTPDNYFMMEASYSSNNAEYISPQDVQIMEAKITEYSKNQECPKPECPKPKCISKIPECPEKTVECPKPCNDPMASYGWGWLGALILWFIIFTVLFWLIFYSLKPAFVLQADSNQVDTAKVLLAAVIAALILVIIIWLIKAAVNRRYS